MFSLFRSDPIKKLTKLHDSKLEQAMHAQRKGDIKTYSLLNFEADQIHQEIQAIEADHHRNKAKHSG